MLYLLTNDTLYVLILLSFQLMFWRSVEHVRSLSSGSFPYQFFLKLKRQQKKPACKVA